MVITRHTDQPIPSPARPDSYIFSTTTDQKYAYGTILDLADGRRFRYCKAGATALAINLMNQAPVAVGNWIDRIQTTATAGVIGDITYKASVATAPTANQWDGGFFVVNKGANELGHMYEIASHTLTTTPVITIADPGGLRAALSVTSEITVFQNPYNSVVINAATTIGQKVVGVALVAIPIGEFGWLQTRGPCPMTADTTSALVLGQMAGAIAGHAVAGTVDILGGAATDVPYGIVKSIVVATETAVIDLQLE